MLNVSVGEIAALVTATAWAVSCQLHGAAAKKLGVPVITVARIPYTALILAAVCLIAGVERTTDGTILLYLCASAFFGVALCDTSFYYSVTIIGPRMAALAQSMSSCFTAVLGYIILGEHIGAIGALGIGIAVFGVFLVMADRGNLAATLSGQLTRRDLAVGAGAGLFSALMLGSSLIILKQALLMGTNALWAAFVRIIFGGCILFVFYFFRGWIYNIKTSYKSCTMLASRSSPLVFFFFNVFGSLLWLVSDFFQGWKGTFRENTRSWIFLLIGGLFGTLGIWMSGVAVQNTEAGIAATIIALEPVIIIPINSVWEKRLPSLRAIIGTFIAFIGIATLFMR